MQSAIGRVGLATGRRRLKSRWQASTVCKRLHVAGTLSIKVIVIVIVIVIRIVIVIVIVIALVIATARARPHRQRVDALEFDIAQVDRATLGHVV